MEELRATNESICQFAVLLLIAGAALFAVQAARAHPRRAVAMLQVAVPTAAVALLVRTLAPFGPLINSGRDLRYLDAVVLGPARAHTHLMAALLHPVAWLDDPVAALEWAQIALGAAGAGLIAALAYGLVRRRLPALMTGLLAAMLVVLIRVDSSLNAFVALRFALLLTLLLALGFVRTGSPIAWVGLGGGLVAISYGRLEGVLFAGLILVWLVAHRAVPTARRARRFTSLRTLSVLLALTMCAALLTRLLLPVMAAAVLAALWWRRGRWPIPGAVAAVGVVTALALIPRVLELSPLARDTSGRFPLQLIYLLGKTNIVLFDAPLCTPWVAVLTALGIIGARRSERFTLTYAACVAFPVWTFAVLFMGNASARVKLQGAGILLLLPLAGLGAERLVAWANLRARRPALWWSLLAAAVISSVSVLSRNAIRAPTSLDHEYAFLRSLRARLTPGASIHALPRTESKSILEIPRALQQRGRFRVHQLDLDRPHDLPPESLVWLGVSCQRFRESEPLPGPERSLGDQLRDVAGWSTIETLARIVSDKDGTLQRLFDRLDVDERPECSGLRERYALKPAAVSTATRSPWDGHYLPRTVQFGLYRVTKGQPQERP